MSIKAKIVSGVFGAAMLIAVPFITAKEGESLTAYQDIAGVWTICNGETLGVKAGDVKTRAECQAMTEARTAEFMGQVYQLTGPDITPHQLAAYSSFAYNIGVAGFARSETLRLYRAGDHAASCRAMMNWTCITVPAGRGDAAGVCKTKAQNKRQVRGLVNRRQAEINLCFGGIL